MGKNGIQVIFIALMVLTVVIVDVAFFRNHTAERLAANIGIILIYVAFYYRFIKRG
jgi:succinate-acetate transporter protein